MGWAAEDTVTREEAKVLVAQARQALYRLRQKLQQIQHQEKREPMLRNAIQAYNELDELDGHLYR